jgi:hypothetical protein
MSDHYCEIMIYDKRGACDKLARFYLGGVWLCADHYDSITNMNGTAWSLNDDGEVVQL